MKFPSKILIAYDGSECADAALSDLKHAGLDPKAVARVITVCDTWLPTVEAMSIATDVVFGQVYATSRVQIQTALKESRLLAEKGAQLLRKDFPGWKVASMTVLDAPASGILDAAGKWKPSLIVLGSKGHSVLGRILLGSVSHKVLTHASCNVRIVRPGSAIDPASPRILAAVDGSKDADIMIKRLALRSWGKDTEFRVVVVIDYRLSMVHDFQAASGVKGPSNLPQRIAEAAESTLAAHGHKVTSVVREGDPRREIRREIKRFKANSLFLGSRGLGAVGRFLLGSVSSNLTEQAPCTVEVDRR